MGVAKYYQSPHVPGAPGKAPRCDVLIDIQGISELATVKADSGGITVGAGVTLTELIKHLRLQIAAAPDVVYAGLVRHLKRVAHVQVRNAGSWAGNLCLVRHHPLFASDVATILAGARATITTQTLEGGAKDHTVKEFLDGQDRTGLLISMRIPSASPAPAGGGTVGKTLFYSDKTAMRHVNAHAVVNCAFRAELAADGKVATATVAVAGVTSELCVCTQASAALVGQPLDQATLAKLLAALEDDVAAAGPNPDLRQTAAYRSSLLASFAFKFILQAQESLPAALASAVVPFAAAEDRPVSTASQSFTPVPSESPVGQAIPKLSAVLQCTGEAQYTSDSAPWGALHGQLVVVAQASGKIAKIDATAALAMPNVVDFVTKADIPAGGSNLIPVGGESLFFSEGDTIQAQGLCVGCILATDPASARAAALCVEVTLSFARPQEPREVGLKEHNAAFQGLVAIGGHTRRGLPTYLKVPRMHCGDQEIAAGDKPPNPEWESGEIVGNTVTGGQKHFYMECQACVCTPQEDGRMEVLAGTQDPAYAQTTIAIILGRPANRITAKVRRVGGAFGGKLTRFAQTAGACSVAAAKHNRPVSVFNERVSDFMQVNGREPIEFAHRGSYDADGTVTSLTLTPTMNAGYFVGDVSGDISMAVGFSDNVYYTAHYACKGSVVTSQRPHYTSQRAPGVIQSVYAHEVCIEQVAHALGLAHEEVQEKNFYQVGQTTPYGDHIGSDTYNWTIPQLWSQCKEDASFDARKAAVVAFNKANRWRKRGIALQPVKYVMGIQNYHEGALVSIFNLDGTVEVSIGGVELGQGINTKVAQVVAYALGIPLDDVVIAVTTTAKTPDQTGTGGSGTSECSARAAQNACELLNARLAPYKEKAGKGKWVEALTAAANDGVALAAYGSYHASAGNNANCYATYGVSCSEAEIDVLTGEMQILRADVHMDLGTSLNPMVDIGQLEGGFVITLGYLFSECALYDPDHHQLNLGTWECVNPNPTAL